MKKTIIAVLAAATVITGITAVSATGMHRTGTRHRTGVCTVEDCQNNCHSVYSECHRNRGGHHRGHCEKYPEYCQYR